MRSPPDPEPPDEDPSVESSDGCRPTVRSTAKDNSLAYDLMATNHIACRGIGSSPSPGEAKPLEAGRINVGHRELYHRVCTSAGPAAPVMVHVHGFGISGTYLEPTAVMLAGHARHGTRGRTPGSSTESCSMEVVFDDP